MVSRVMIVDNYPLVREGLKRIIEQEVDFTICGETGSLRQARSMVPTHRPDIVILDLMLQDGSGLELIRRLKSDHPEIRILVCSMHDEVLFAERAVSSGAHGFMDKHEAARNTVKALRQIRAGKMFLRPHVVDRLINRSMGNQPKLGSPIDLLTDRELEVFLLIAQGCSTGTIATKLIISVKTVDTHRDKIKRKLGLTSAGELVRAAVLWDVAQYGGNATPCDRHTDWLAGASRAMAVGRGHVGSVKGFLRDPPSAIGRGQTARRLPDVIP